uniref:Chloride channel protein n=1 Tax=Ditylum brightwellii TaxID=49249 RepID=A0A7S4VX51_9STRA
MPSLNLTEDHFDSEDDHTDQGLSTTPRRASSGYRDDPSSFVTPKNSNRILRNRSSHVNIRSDGYGGKENGRYTKLSHIPSAPLNVQSHNYEPDESEVWRAYVAQQHFSNRGQWWTTGKKRSLKRWALTFMVGVIQGILAFLCNMVTRFLSSTKFDHVNALLQAGIETEDVVNARGGNDDMLGTFDDVVDHDTEVVEMEESKGWWSFGGSAFLAFLFYQTLFAGIASFFVYLEPVSGGSGIPEIKCFLNGIDLPRVVRVKTLICKVVGVTFSVAAGLPVGKEGPMVHSGAVVAAGISQGRTKFWGVDTSFSKFSDFRNDREKRDFVACGAAAGVTSAFGAPIGGVLFSLEEGASYWSTKLTWRAFFCAMITLGTLFAVRNFDSLWGQADIDKLFSFGEFNSLSGEASNFSIWELLLSIIIGCLGGLIGAVFNAANEHLTIWHMKHTNHSPSRRCIEVVVISIFVTTISFVMPLVWNRCTE